MASGQFGRDKPSSRPKINPRDVVDLVSSTATSDSEYKKNGAMEDKKAPVAKTETEGALKRKSAAMSTAVGEDGKYKSIYAAEESKTKKAKLSDSDGKDESHDEDNHDHDRDSNSDNDGHNSDTESLFDEQFPILGDDALVDGSGNYHCTLKEARILRQMLREMGPKKFINEVIYEEDVPARKLLNAFGCDLPAFLEDSPDENMYTYLNYAMVRELKRRPKQDKYNTIEDAVDLLLKSKNIIVLTGAGISTSLGIPDFRSKNGLYALLGDRQDIDDPQDVFDIEVFREEPHIFFEVAGKIVPKVEDHRYTPTHKFIKLLEDKGKLLTNYTQNIDNIESYAGISPSKIIQCHGSFATATCMVNKNHKVKGEEIFPTMREGEIPYCKQCEVELATQQPKKKRRSRHSNGKRKKRAEYEDSSDDEGQFDVPTPGIMKPDITFFREALPDTFSNRLVDHDRKKVDLVIVIGTSMKVAPVSDVVDFLHNVPTIYISREPVKHIYFDIDLIGDCDVVVAELCRRAKWKLEHEMIPKNQVVKVWSGGKHFPSRWYFKEKSEPYQAGIKKPSISEDEATVEAKIEEVVKREKVKSEKMKNGTNERKASSTKRIKYEFDSDEERESYNAAKAKAKALAAVKREVASDEESL